ncbi:MAG: pilus assembly protein [Acidobacteria bacterium]|nr:pilus assembly protein [Acidobacteriota bacterium]
MANRKQLDLRAEQAGGRRGDRRKGATLVEFAMSFLLFITMLVGLVEASRLVWAYTTLAHAARRGARFVMVHNGRNPASDTDVANVVKDYTIGLVKDNVTVTPTYADSGRSGGSTATIEVSYPFQFLASPMVFAENGLTLKATSKTTLAQ